VPSIVKETSVGIGAVLDNMFNGSAYEFASRRRVASIGLTAAATGTFATLQSGPDIVAEEFAPIVKTVMPVIPDDFFFNDVMDLGDRLVLRIRNPTAGAIIHRGVANLTDF
jgi:hypothetical protein